MLRDVSFTAHDSEFVVVLGPSGCGKSTALRLIAGLERADSGDIRIDGERVNELPPAERRLAMVFQNYALFPHLTIADNIVFGLKVRRVDTDTRRRQLERVAEQLGLVDQLHKRPAQLSGGQRQRVALARALVSDASLILMDEPLSNLDAKLRQQMRLELRQVQRDLGLTIVYVTHDQVEAMTMADRVVLLRDGELEQVDHPRTLYRRPATTWVAGFIGSPPMNLLPGRIVQGVLRLGQQQLPALPGLHTSDASTNRSDGEVLLGIRPEQISVIAPTGDDGAATSTTPTDITLTGTLRAVELLGSDTLLTLELDDGASLVVRAPGELEPSTGDAITVRWRSTDTLLYGAESGRLLTDPSSPRPTVVPHAAADLAKEH